MTHEQRVMDEHKELFIKISALTKFITSDVFNGLDEKDKELLRDQKCFMEDYLNVLTARINRMRQV